MQLTIDKTTKDSFSVLAVSGEVDVHSAPQLHEAILDEIAEGNTNIALDFTNVSFLDSSGLRVLIIAHNALEAADGAFALVAPSERILKVFRATSLHKRLRIESTLDDLV